jgi:hypothetical protein
MNTFITSNTGGVIEMKSGHRASMLLLTVLIVPMFIPIVAQSNHTLEWGVDLDERFTYVLQREFYTDSSSKANFETQIDYLGELQEGEKFILEVDTIETIEEQMNISSSIPKSICNLRREDNDSIFIENLLGFVLPIGDWDLLEEIDSVRSPGLTFVETDDEWGTIGTGVIPETDITEYIEMRYEKENGTLTYLRYRYTTLGTDLVDIILAHWYPGMPTVIGGDIQLATILIIAISGSTGVIVAFLVYRYFKGKKSIVQRLGE